MSSCRKLSVILAIWLWAVTPSLFGQIHPSISNRQAIATALNGALTSIPTTVITSNTEVFDAVENTCLNVESLKFDLVDGGDHFLLKRLLRPGHTLSGELRHPLVDDLNNWLNKVWAMDLTQIPEFNDLSWSCSNPSQRYYLRSTSDPSLIAALQDATGESAMLRKSYIIDGVAYPGEDLLEFAEPGERRVPYITDGEATSDSTRRLLAGAYLKFTCPNGGPSIEIKFSVQLENYSPDCGETKTQLMNIELTGTGISCSFLLGGSIPDGRNATVFEKYLDSRKNWTIDPELAPLDDYRGLQLGKFDITSSAELRFRMPHNWACTYNEVVLCKIVDLDVDDEYCEVAYCYGGTFSIDALGHLVYTLPTSNACGVACTSQVVPCVEFCDYGAPTLPTISGVIKADAVTFSDKVDVPLEANEPLYGAVGERSLFERGIRGKWRPQKSYVYRTDIKPGSGLFSTNTNAASERNYNDAGIFNLQLFSWKYPQALNANWLNLSTVSLYSRNGEGLEDANILSIKSATRFGYGGQVPILVAKNSPYDGPLYESFEDAHFDTDNSNGEVSDMVSHSGTHSYNVPDAGYSEPIASGHLISTEAGAGGMTMRLWAKLIYPSSTGWNGECPVDVRLERLGGSNIDLANTSFRYVAKTGEWALYEYEIGSVTEGFYNIRLRKAVMSSDVWVDDIRLQPQLSEMVCYAYDPRTLKPVAIFDDQHFGIYYQYNGQGELVRKIRETERGFRTVEEAQYHTPLIARDYGSENSAPMATHKGDVSQATILAEPVKERYSKQPAGDANNSKLDLFNAEFGIGRRSVKVFGIDADSLGDRVEKLKRLLTIPSIEQLGIPGAEKLALIEKLMILDDSLISLEQTRGGARDSVQRAGRERAIAATMKQKKELLQRLGVSESEARELIDAARRVREELEEETNN